MANDSYFRFDDDNNMKYTSTRIRTIIKDQMGKLNTDSPKYCMKSN